MPIFRRSPLLDRAQTLTVNQPIKAIDITPTGIGLHVKEDWLRCNWSEIQNAILLRKEVLMSDGPFFLSSTFSRFRLRTPEEAIALMEQRRTEKNSRQQRLRRMGISTREILSFRAFDRVWNINLSSVGSHFEQNELLRSILIAELHPTEIKRGIWVSPGLWIIIVLFTFFIFGLVIR